jgi:uncharacterized protein YbcI
MTSGSLKNARGNMALDISNGMVQLLHEYTGRGATKARTTINTDTVMILLGDTLTKAEHKLVERGRARHVIEGRAEVQDIMREDAIAMVESVIERRVVAFMSLNHIDPDLAAEVFVLEPVAEQAPTAPVAEGDSD